jgi:hypothetical protein
LGVVSGGLGVGLSADAKHLVSSRPSCRTAEGGHLDCGFVAERCNKLTERLFFDGVRAMKLLTEIKHGSFFGNGETRRSCAAKRLNDLNGCLFPKGFAAGPNIRNKRKLNTDFERLQDAILIFSKGVTCFRW